MFKIKAPEFSGIKAWINSKPLKMADLKDKVVLVEFWTYTCINCQRTLPYLKKWHQRYSKKGLVIVGVHSPEFSFEKDIDNVKKAVKKHGIRYPVAVDNDHETWDAFENRYWPSRYIIADGFVEYLHFGEGNYEDTEMMIQELLGTSRKAYKEKIKAYMPDQSPETYAGFARNEGLGSGLVCDKKGCDIWVAPKQLSPNVIYPEGRWEQEKEYLELKKAPGKITYRFNAREVNVVMEPVGKSAKVDVFIDYKKKETITISSSNMYEVYKGRRYGYHELGLIFKGKVRVYVFTFG